MEKINKFLNRINLDKYNRRPSNEARPAKNNATARLDEDWPVFQENANDRIEALQEYVNRRNERQLESIERYYGKKTYVGNVLCLQALKDLLTLTAGLSMLVRIRMND